MALKSKQNRTIVLPISESNYELFMTDNKEAHRIITKLIKQMPECFPVGVLEGYVLNGKTRVSKKTAFQMRKIRVDSINYRIRPSFILPYQRGKTSEVSNGLFLLRFGVPFWALALVFGRNPMWWYRLYISFSDFSLVGTTVRDGDSLAAHVLADEKHIKIRGQKAYVATTVGQGCFLGMHVSMKADEEALFKSYQIFKAEAMDINTDYQPDTVNTDGWMATQNAWKSLYPMINVIECFLHAFIKIRDRATKQFKMEFKTAGDKVWNCYKAESRRALAQQIRRLKEWATDQIMSQPMKENILRLCSKKQRWMNHFNEPNAHRTSNMLDRLMKAMKRHAFNSQMFHGKTVDSATKNFRAFGLLYNFTPSSPSVWKEDKSLTSPAARLNGFIYHKDWLENLLISASLGGYFNHRNLL